MIYFFATTLLLGVSAIDRVAQAPTQYGIVPKRAFEVQVDRFDQVVSEEVQCGEMPADILRVEMQPAPPAQSKFSFVNEPNQISIRFQSLQSSKPILSGGPSWVGKKLICNWRTFPRIDVGEGITQFRTYLASAALVVTLKDGRTMILSPPPFEGTIVVERNAEGALGGEIDFGTQFSHATLAIEDMSGIPWILLNKKLRAIEGKLGKKDLRIELIGSKCTIRQINAPFEELARQKRLLQENNELKACLTASQLALLLPECEALEKSIAELESRAGLDRSEPALSTLRLLITDELSGRMYGLLILDIRS